MTDAQVAQQNLLQWAAVAIEVYQSLRAGQVPEPLAADLTFAWLTTEADD